MPAPDALAAASAALGRSLTADAGEQLSGSDRSGVVRARDDESTVVVKSYAGGDLTSWARERVGLQAAGPLGCAPRLLGVASDPPVVVMEDLGAARSVADHLLGTDPAEADDALLAWARTLGRLHAATHVDRASIAASFAAAEADALARTPRDDPHAGVLGSLDDATAAWAVNAEQLGITGPPDVGSMGAALVDDEHHALSPADVCPDNNLLLDDGCRLIDFEWAEVRHPAWDAAYLAVPWPSCWCAWRIPDATSRRAMEAYRGAASEGIPYVASDAFEDDVRTACTCWALVSVSWSLSTALRQEGHPHPLSPGTRPRMQHRLAMVAASGTAAAGFAAEVLEHTREQWGDLVLPLAPAYRS